MPPKGQHLKTSICIFFIRFTIHPMKIQASSNLTKFVMERKKRSIYEPIELLFYTSKQAVGITPTESIP